MNEKPMWCEEGWVLPDWEYDHTQIKYCPYCGIKLPVTWEMLKNFTWDDLLVKQHEPKNLVDKYAVCNMAMRINNYLRSLHVALEGY